MALEEPKADELTTEEPPKKLPRKMLPESPPTEWPSAWLMPDGDCENQKAENRCDPNVDVSVEELKELGIW